MGVNPSSVVRDQTSIDREHLRLLAIFHFVAAGMAFCGLMFIVVHYLLFHLVMSDPRIWATSKEGPPPQVIFAIMRIVYVVFGIWFSLSGAANVLSGLFLRRFRYRVFSLVVAGFNCIYIPFGTLLGVFTILVLSRDSVRRSYKDVATQPAA